MPLFLCDLAPLVGKDEDTLARWCEREGVIPGAYRTRGGARRRGKWRVAIPRAHPEDIALALARAHREGIDLEEYVALLTLDRLCNRIVANSRGFSRKRRDKQTEQLRQESIQKEAQEFASKGARVWTLDLERLRRDYAIGAVRLIAERKDPAPAAYAAFSLQQRGKQKKSARELSKFGAALEADPFYALAVALASDAYKKGNPRGLTIEALARELGLSRGQAYRQPEVAEKLKRALRAARSYALALAKTSAPDPGKGEMRVEAPRPDAEQTDRERALRAEYEQWVAGMSPDEFREAMAMPHVREQIAAAVARIAKKKRRAT